jgi:hypothetical protein
MAFVFSSCNKEDEKAHPFRFVNLSFYEQLTAGTSSLFFDLNTIENFPCNNFTLQVMVSSASGTTDIRINDIEVPDICISTEGPATQLIQLEALHNEHTRFSVWVNNKRHEFQLRLEPQTITVIQGRPFENHLLFTYDTLMRIPANTVWGYLVYNPSKHNWPQVWQQIKQAFEQAGVQPISLPDGNYHFFSMKDDSLSFENVSQQAQTFYFGFDKPTELLQQAYENVIKELGLTEIQLRLFDTSGERFIL